MSEQLTCELVRERGLVPQYVAGTLPDAEVEALEEHFLDCAACQEEIRLGAAIRAGLSAGAAVLPSRSWPRWLALGGGFGVAAAAALMGIFFLSRQPDPEWHRLGEVSQPPIYLGVPVRASLGAGDSLFAAAMTAYVAGDQRTAAAGLRAALQAGVNRGPAEFFLAASLLELGDASGAAEWYGRVLARGDSPYRVEAALYRARALLLLDRPREALSSLRAIASDTGGAADEARLLGRRIEAHLRR